MLRMDSFFGLSFTQRRQEQSRKGSEDKRTPTHELIETQNYTVDGMDNSLRPDVNAVRCTACSTSRQQFLAVLSILT